MHLEFISDGRIKDLDELEKWLSTRIFSMPVTSKKGKTRQVNVPGMLRVQRKYSFIFPEENLDFVLNALNLSEGLQLCDKKGSVILKKTFALLRKVLRLKKIPEIRSLRTNKKMAIEAGILSKVRLIGIGIKKDRPVTEPNGDIHEGL